jgi:hypothetical protein
MRRAAREGDESESGREHRGVGDGDRQITNLNHSACTGSETPVAPKA